MKAIGVVMVLVGLNTFGAPDFFVPGKRKLNQRLDHPFGINAYGFGPVGLAAVSADWFITPKVAFEAGGGFRDFDGSHAFTLGFRYHLFGKSFLKLTPYVGVYTAFHHNGTDLQNHAIYIPVGLHKIKKNKFSWSAEVAWQSNVFLPADFYAGFRVGYRF